MLLGFTDWRCVCGCVNYEFRKRCRYCNETQEFAALAERIGDKSREIAATGACQWGYRTAAEIAAMPDDK